MGKSAYRFKNNFNFLKFTSYQTIFSLFKNALIPVLKIKPHRNIDYIVIFQFGLNSVSLFTIR
jgi:hypothetical protein